MRWGVELFIGINDFSDRYQVKYTSQPLAILFQNSLDIGSIFGCGQRYHLIFALKLVTAIQEIFRV